jgi:DNA-binding NtrC family response regulator
MSGIELLRIVKEKYPRIVRLVLSGYTQVGTLLTAINQGEIFKFITKPWKLEEEFKSIIKEALARYDAQVESEKTAEASVTSDAS